MTDCEGALRCVVRYNHIVNAGAGDHGTEGGTTRGERASEMYDNVLEYTTGTTANMGTRGGNKLAHDNQITKSTIRSLGAINYYRGFGGGQGGTWGNADGTSPWDKCVTDVDPGGEFPGLDQSKQHWIDGHLPAYLFYSGTASADDPATNGGIGTLIVSGSPWTVGQWVGYSVTNLDYPRNFTDGVSTIGSVTFTSNTAQFASTDVGLKITGTNIPAGTTIAVRNSATSINLSQAATASGSGLSVSVKGRKTRGGYITANTDHTITFALYSSTDRGGRNRFLTGDRYQIHRVIKALDVAGSGKGDLVAIEGSVALNQAYTPHQAIWPRQIQEPTITWNNKNTVTNAYLGFNSATPFVHVGDNSSRSGLDLYNLGGPFPADSTPQKVIDVLPASINGAQYNGTFCYPHPLVTGVPCGAPTPTPTPTGTPTP